MFTLMSWRVIFTSFSMITLFHTLWNTQIDNWTVKFVMLMWYIGFNFLVFVNEYMLFRRKIFNVKWKKKIIFLDRKTKKNGYWLVNAILVTSEKSLFKWCTKCGLLRQCIHYVWTVEHSEWWLQSWIRKTGVLQVGFYKEHVQDFTKYVPVLSAKGKELRNISWLPNYCNSSALTENALFG